MRHIVFDRANNAFKVFDLGIRQFLFEASGSAVGDGINPPYTHDCQIPQGHYKLTQVERFAPIPSEGAGQVYVADLTPRDISVLAQGRKAKWILDKVIIGGILLPIGRLATYGRAEIMLHGGGTVLGEPACYAPNQPLCKTCGCTRMHNADLAQFMDWLEPIIGQDHVIYSVAGDSPPLPR